MIRFINNVGVYFKFFLYFSSLKLKIYTKP